MAAALIPATRAEALHALGDFVDGPVLRYREWFAQFYSPGEAV